MPWKKGQSGNPLGRLPGEKQFADQLRIVLAEPVDKNDPKSVRKMRRIAEKLVECAMKGEGWAISQVADRIDGRPKQESDFSIASTRYVVEVPPQLSLEEWEKKYALPTAQRFNAVPRSDGPP
jgi:Family of unknown function (DUF5681)